MGSQEPACTVLALEQTRLLPFIGTQAPSSPDGSPRCAVVVGSLMLPAFTGAHPLQCVRAT